MRVSSQPNPQEIQDQFINAFQKQKQELQAMQQQNRILTNFSQRVLRKDEEIQELQKLVKKYRKYYDDYELVKATLTQKIREHDAMLKENKVLFVEVNQVVAENKELRDQLLAAEKIKHQFIKERNSTDVRFREIQQTFREYQEECKSKEKQLLKDLDKAYQQIKDSSSKLDDLQSVKFENEQLKAKITNFNTSQLESSPSHRINDPERNSKGNGSILLNPAPIMYHSQGSRRNGNISKSKQNSPNKSYSRMYDYDANAQIDRLRRELVNKQVELQRSKSLNHELSIEFDKSVNKICEFERELSMYRKQNHELKKTLSLFVEKEQYEKMHRSKLRHHGSNHSEDEEDEEDEEEEDSDTPGDSQVSDSRRRV